MSQSDDRTHVQKAPSLGSFIFDEETALTDLLRTGVISQDEVNEAFSGQSALSIFCGIRPEEERGKRRTDRASLLGNYEFLSKKARDPDAPAWFRSLYLWLAALPCLVVPTDSEEETHDLYASFKFVLGSDGKLYEGRCLVFPDDPAIPDVRMLSSFDPALEYSVTVHRSILQDASTEDAEKRIRELLCSQAGVYELDAAGTCFFTMVDHSDIVTSRPQPSPEKLVEQTRLFVSIMRKHPLSSRFLQSLRRSSHVGLWVLATDGHVRRAKEVALSEEYCPDISYGDVARGFGNAACFLNSAYLPEYPTLSDVRSWRHFFWLAGVKGKLQ